MSETGHEKLTFRNREGTELAAALSRPDSPRGYALFAHCFTCSKDLPAAARISRQLAREGIGALRFDFTGLGGSQGDFGNTSFSSNIDDLVAAADFMREELEAPRILVGHSLGGVAVIAAASQIPEAVAVATIGAPSDPGHLRHIFQDDLDEIEEKGTATVDIGGRPFKISKSFLRDIETSRLEPKLKELGKALLIFHSPKDQIVSIDHARRIFRYAKHPKSFVSLDEADHLLKRESDSRYVARVVTAWATRYLE